MSGYLRDRKARRAALAAVLVIVVLFPVLDQNPAYQDIGMITLMYVGLGSSWNIIGGFAGYISLGQAAFFGLGAYTLGLIVEHLKVGAGYLPFAWLPVVGLVTAVLAIPIGWAALRTRHAVFATVTIAMMFVVQLLAENLIGLTGGSAGLGFPVPLWSPAFFNIPFYYAMLVLAVITIAAAWAIRRSGLGLGLLAIRDDENKAEAVGVPTRSYKLTAFVISAGLAGMIGGVYGYSVTYIYPQSVVDPLIAMGAVLMPFVGGVGTLSGPVLGAILIAPAQLELSYYANGQLYLILYGAVFLAVIVLMPRGIIPSVADWLESRRLGGARAVSDGADGPDPGGGAIQVAAEAAAASEHG
jgi:branched-chain amino acid transport system permease protein